MNTSKLRRTIIAVSIVLLIINSLIIFTRNEPIEDEYYAPIPEAYEMQVENAEIEPVNITANTDEPASTESSEDDNEGFFFGFSFFQIIIAWWAIKAVLKLSN